MERIELLLDGTFTWPGFFSLLALQVGLYFLLRLAHRLLAQSVNWGPLLSWIKVIVSYVLLVYEPLALVLLGSAFVLIKPLFHGLMLLLVLLMTFKHLRNYFSGRLLLLQSLLATGRSMTAGEQQGTIASIGRQGITLQTNNGLAFINYTQLVEQGFSVEMSEAEGGYFYLKIKAEKLTSKLDPKDHFMDLLIATPYLDPQFKPEINAMRQGGDSFQVKLLLQEESHLYELVALINEWGYDCELITN